MAATHPSTTRLLCVIAMLVATALAKSVPDLNKNSLNEEERSVHDDRKDNLNLNHPSKKLSLSAMRHEIDLESETNLIETETGTDDDDQTEFENLDDVPFEIESEMSENEHQILNQLDCVPEVEGQRCTFDICLSDPGAILRFCCQDFCNAVLGVTPPSPLLDVE